MRTFVNTLICIFSAIFSAFGIMSLLYVANIYQLSF